MKEPKYQSASERLRLLLQKVSDIMRYGHSSLPTHGLLLRNEAQMVSGPGLAQPGDPRDAGGTFMNSAPAQVTNMSALPHKRVHVGLMKAKTL